MSQINPQWQEDIRKAVSTFVERRKNATQEEIETVATEFHRWLIYAGLVDLVRKGKGQIDFVNGEIGVVVDKDEIIRRAPPAKETP